MPHTASERFLPKTATVRERPLRILHFSVALGGGLTTALEDYVLSTPSLEHHILGSGLPHLVADVPPALGERMMPLVPPGHLARLRALISAIKELEPDILHAHSSLAGAYARLVPLPDYVGVVYSPHCFSFERKDVAWATRTAFWLAEALLSLRPACIAAVGMREGALAGRLPGHRKIFHVPHIVRDTDLPKRRRGDGAEPFTAVTAGRVCAQKDPYFFAQAAELCKPFGIRWIWIGGGSTIESRALSDAGVEVTGWVDRRTALELMASADVYVHTASWEAAVPIAILEAAALGLPVLARDIPSIRQESTGLPLFDSPQNLRNALVRLSANALTDETSRYPSNILEGHSHQDQRAALMEVYEAVWRGLDGRR